MATDETLVPGTPAPRAIASRRWRRYVLWGLLLAVLLLVGDYYLYPVFARPGGAGYNRGENGLWLRYTWYFGEHTNDEVRALGAHLRRDGIRYAYFHIRSVQPDGSLRFHHRKEAQRLTAALHRSAPGVKALAWVYAGEAGGDSAPVKLTDPAVRARMAGEAAWLVRECGFDGVQWDYEICRDGDTGFLALLEDTRHALPPGAVLSAATPLYLIAPLRRWGWGDTYFGAVARRCDQLSVMVYDSMMYTPRSYVALARNQAWHVTRAVARTNPHCRVLLGLPTYEDVTRAHNPHAENLLLGLKGVREGLADARAVPATFAGIALFADYTTDESEWQTYRRWWTEDQRPEHVEISPHFAR
jgi:hypothetical protein